MGAVKKRCPHNRVGAGACLAATALTLLFGSTRAGDASPDQADACLGFIKAAEKVQAIPEGLLMAIGYTESGRVIADGRRVPWPWTVNAQGEGYAFESKTEAIAFVENLQAHGISVIDVGCMQVNLYYHPDAFESLDAAFDPATNVSYAARFLKELYNQSDDWDAATRYYHSRTPYLGRVYAGQVSANGFGGITSDIGLFKPLSAKERTILSDTVSDHLIAANELIAVSSAAWTTKAQARTVGQPVAIAEPGSSSVGGPTLENKESLD
jgi:hypothetical protein